MAHQKNDAFVDIKLVVVGDGTVGKTCLLMRYINDSFDEDYIPTVFETCNMNDQVDGKSINLTVFDTAGQEEYDRLRPISYPGTDVYLVCFSTISPDSFANIKEKWIPEIAHYSPKVPYVLVGCKTDLRQNDDSEVILPQQGHKLAEEINAVTYIECSALASNRESIERAISTVLKPAKKHRKNDRKCAIL